jgi:ABC-type sugar transport system permease subunit
LTTTLAPLIESPLSVRQKLWAAQQRYAPYLFVSPFVAMFALFLFYPLTRSLVLSLYQTAANQRRFVGLANYFFLARDKYFWLAVLNTFILAFGFLLIQIPSSLGLAMLLNQRLVRFKSFFRFAFFSTYLVGPVFVSVLFAQMLNPRQGLVNQVIGDVVGSRVEIPWLTNEYLARVSILLAWLWLAVGYGMIYFLAALQAVDQELYEAADVDGANRWHRFWNVTLPGIRPVMLFLILVGTISAMQIFEIPYIFFPQNLGPNNSGLTIVMYLFNTGFQIGDLGYASAIGWVLVLIVGSLSLVQLRAIARTQ